MPLLPEIRQPQPEPSFSRGKTRPGRFCLLFLLAAALLAAGSCNDGNGPDTTPVETAPTPREATTPQAQSDAAGSPAPAPVDKRRDEIQQILAAYNPERQFDHINTLAADSYQGRLTGTAGARAAAGYIAAEFSRLGLQPWQAAGLTSFRQSFNASGLESENIIGVLPGSNPDGAYVILAAHYDHLGVDESGAVYNGADDNAAGVAALLEAAAILRQLGLKPEKTIVFCAFGSEEQGQLGAISLGRHLTNAGLAGKGEMINIDGIGATGGGYFGVWDEGAAITAPLVNTLKEAGRILGIPVREEGTDIGSDAQPFDWEFGIPAVTVDWSWGQDTAAFHPYYHTVDDDAVRIDRTALASATRMSIIGLWLRAA